MRTLNWIELIERPSIPGESPAASHSSALDMALARVTTPYVLSIHTDTLVRRDDWLQYLLAQIEKDPQIAGVGSWKLESKPWLRRIAKQFEQFMQTHLYRLLNKSNHAIAGQGENYYYLRSHCALYRMDRIRQFNLHFGDGDAVAGKLMHKKLVDQGYKMIFLRSEDLGQYIDHINHATMILNPALGARDKTIKEGRRRIEQRLQAVNADQILADVSLDH